MTPSLDIRTVAGETTTLLERTQVASALTQPGQFVHLYALHPTDADWRWLGEAFGLHPLAVAEARERTLRPRLAVYSDHLGLSLRLWVGATGADSDDLEDVTREIDFFLGERYFLEIHEAQDGLPRSDAPTPGRRLHALLCDCLDRIHPAMDSLDAQIDRLEASAYSLHENCPPGPALRLKKQLLLLRQSVAPVRDAANQLLRLTHPALPPEMAPYLHDIYDRALRLIEQIDLHREIVGGVLEAIAAQTSNRLNHQMKRLTALAAIALPVTAITGFFGMNIGHFDQAPTWSVYATIGGMGMASLAAWLFFRRKGYW